MPIGGLPHCRRGPRHLVRPVGGSRGPNEVAPLRASDISGNFMTEMTAFPSSLVANWQFDDPDGTTASDSAASHTATLHGGAVFSSDVHR